MWGHGPSPASSRASTPRAHAALADDDADAVPLDAALADSRMALERHRQQPDNLGFMHESIEKLGVAE